MKRNFINNNKKSVSRSYPKNYNGFTSNTLSVSLYGVYLRHNRGPIELLDLLQNPDNTHNINNKWIICRGKTKKKIITL